MVGVGVGILVTFVASRCSDPFLISKTSAVTGIDGVALVILATVIAFGQSCPVTAIDHYIL